MNFFWAGLILVTAYIDHGRTASGVFAGPGVAACPPGWMGQVVEVEGEGDVACLDRYASYWSPRIDIWKMTLADAKRTTGYRNYRTITFREASPWLP